MKRSISFAKRHLSSNLPGDPDVVLPRAMFLRMLSLERKRAERSRRNFILMLVDLGAGADDRVGVQKTVAAITATVRETDVAGWYEVDRVPGVIFTEFGATDPRSAVTIIEGRVIEALRAALTPEQLKPIEISFHCFPEGGEVGRVGPASTTLYPELKRRAETRRTSFFVKRAIDLVASAAALLVLAPLFLVIAAAIRLTSPGRIFFRQERIGQRGVPFMLLKFRSMYSACDSAPHREYVKRFIAGTAAGGDGGTPAVFKLTHDPRVTAVGRWLRKTSLDELPQFLNVLRGEMSLVGPRPPLAYETEAYDVWHRRRLIEMKPGITGLWQVSGRSRVSFDDMVRLDLRYSQTWSVRLDVAILLRTPRTVLFGDGAY